jgi:hypothetical protein
VEHSLERIVAALAKLGRTEVLRRLLPGVPVETIRERFRGVGLQASSGLVALYSWHGGTAVTAGTSLDDVQFFPGFWFLSLDDAIANYVAFRDDMRWNSSWFPVFANGGGDFYAVWIREQGEPVVGFLVDEAEHPVEYASLASMCGTLADCFEEGVFYVDGRGFLEMDDARHADIARRNNPDVEMWLASWALVAAKRGRPSSSTTPKRSSSSASRKRLS